MTRKIDRPIANGRGPRRPMGIIYRREKTVLRFDAKLRGETSIKKTHRDGRSGGQRDCEKTLFFTFERKKKSMTTDNINIFTEFLRFAYTNAEIYRLRRNCALPMCTVIEDYTHGGFSLKGFYSLRVLFLLISPVWAKLSRGNLRIPDTSSPTLTTK